MEKREYFRLLYRKYAENQCLPAEVDELLAYLKSEGFDDIYEIINRESANKSRPHDPVLNQRLENRLQKILDQHSDQNIHSGKVSPLRKIVISRLAAAAAILIIILSSIFFYSQSHKKVSLDRPDDSTLAVKEILPGSHKPMLTLSGGKQILLDSIGLKTLSSQSNTNISIASPDELTYKSSLEKPAISATVYNTLTNPRGSIATNLTLSDGTRVWLNAGSSITYPVIFGSNDRKVEISGEAYFEVAKNPHSPFTVKKVNADTRITVLGTHFNVNMYDDESEDKITLLEGSVKVTASANTLRLLPSEQARVKSGNISLQKNVNLDAIMAWKNGQFLLKGTDLISLLRQLSRWYDVDIEYEGQIPAKRFGGSISRTVSLSTVMEALKQNGVSCRLEGRKLKIEE